MLNLRSWLYTVGLLPFLLLGPPVGLGLGGGFSKASNSSSVSWSLYQSLL